MSRPTEERFPGDFLWGAATSAYQIEGAPLADGAGPSIWHRFVRTPGRVHNGETGDVACDHYNRYREDVALMKELGLTTYRFSVSWSRILPEGTGRVNQGGLDFYRRLVDELLAAGIAPNATLYHWDLPAALDDRGGWLNRDVAEWFAEYADVMFRALDDRVTMWATLNEPWVVTDGGYLHGPLAPGHKNLWEAPRATHNLLRSHAKAVQAYRASGKNQIGLVVNLEPKYPASDSREDAEAVKRADAYMNRQYLDPVFLGSYPQELIDGYGEAWPEISAADLEEIRTPIDFLGINYYKRGITKADDSVIIERAARVDNPRTTVTEVGWEVFAEGLTKTLTWVRDRYGDLPLYITENGAAFYDPPVAFNGRIEDPLRVDYLRDHIRAVRTAMRQGVNVRGYYVWSLLDNFEWALGYAKRFGIIHVDYETLKRTPKASARYYADVIKAKMAL
ncbi:MAG TPA: GH1 family beta-glucosidase [Thermoanaerobaculia bacterium]|nr:GH1 family beta-glucosidase [Thermoanaerobaculia bacterium]